jgi:hypothetical protein
MFITVKQGCKKGILSLFTLQLEQYTIFMLAFDIQACYFL